MATIIYKQESYVITGACFEVYRSMSNGFLDGETYEPSSCGPVRPARRRRFGGGSIASKRERNADVPNRDAMSRAAGYFRRILKRWTP